MKKLLILFFFLAQLVSISAIELSADLFAYDEERIAQEFKELSDLEAIVLANPNASIADIYAMCPHFKDLSKPELITPYSQTKIAAPGNFPSFWFAFTFSAVGFYFFPYGAIAAPISVAIVYFSSKKSKTETKKALWGCLTGAIIGGGIKYAVVNM
jgi:hypothetical protein